ncbi:pumilio homolog 12-like [Rhodamnia argentea]|uniref:Pumilio homolog 12-like n=1 Tax=Rhodamnia argentea TaxID=178133 RepID=A0A8B8PSV0_9MYRT|nr:pumilio homolog 12-like [Rhodamnia argentea]
MESAGNDRSFQAAAFAASACSDLESRGFMVPYALLQNPPLGTYSDAQSLEDGLRSLRLSPPCRPSPYQEFTGGVLDACPYQSLANVSTMPPNRSSPYPEFAGDVLDPYPYASLANVSSVPPNRPSPYSEFTGDVFGAYPYPSPTNVFSVGIPRTDSYDASRLIPDSIGAARNIFRFGYGPSVHVEPLSNHSPALIGDGWIQTDPNVFAMAGSRERLSVENLPSLPALGRAGSCHYNSRFSRPDVSNRRLSEAARTPVSSAAMHNSRRNIRLSTRNGSWSLPRTGVPLDKEKVGRLFNQVINSIGDFMVHQTWNHVIQSLVEVCDEVQRTKILEKVTLQEHRLVKICLDPYGIHAVKKLLDHVTTPYQMKLVVSALLPGVVSLALEKNSVIEHCLRNFPHEYTESLLVELAKNCYHIATNQTGCCTLQACIHYSDRASRECLLVELPSYSLQLAQDPYGNYVVQTLLSLMRPGVTNKVIEVLRGSFLPLSTNKYASHVVERCIKTIGEVQSRQVALELTTSPSCPKLFTDEFGNFVTKTLLEEAHQSWGRIFNYLEKMIEERESQLATHTFGKNVLAKLRTLQRRRCGV